MSNDRLQSALSRARLTHEDVARRVQVDPKTVQKWLAGRIPHPRHRWAVASLLNEEEQFLWPSCPGGSGEPGGTAEIMAAFSHRANVDSTRWRLLITQATTYIDLLGYTLYFLPQQIPELVDVLAVKCESGCKVRVILADPECEQVRLRDEEEQEPITLVARIQTSLRAFAPLFDCPNAKLHYQAAPLYNSIYRFDDEMFVTPHLYATPGHSAPLFHLRRMGPDGIFARFTSHFEQLWSQSRPIMQNRQMQPAGTDAWERGGV